MQDIANKTVMITGASRGLGAALAEAFARAGAPVSICARGRESLEATAARIRAEGGRCLARAVDISRGDEVARWVEETVSEMGEPEVLINNASVLGPRIPMAGYPIESWRQTIDVNLNGAFIVAHAVLPAMLERRTGCIINVSSGAARGAREGWGAYAVSKQALETLSYNLAEEVEDRGVRVNVVDPGAMRTRMRAEAYPDEDPLTLKTPAEATGVFLWLASNASGDATGRRFRADEFTGT